MRVVTIRAHAKLNLSLRVVGTRADGYHELRTVFQTIALHDTLTCALRRGPFALTCDRPDVPLDAANLVWRAAAALRGAAGKHDSLAGVAIHLQKRIPLQGGLGGGSADAAATLLALNEAWQLSLPVPELARIAATIGSDVPFFLSGGTALGVGRGEETYPLSDLPAHEVVLLVPRFGVSTVDAYRWLDADRRARVLDAPAAGYVPRGWPAAQPLLVNDLEAPVASRQPEIAGMVHALRDNGAVAAAMTGSGSTVFGLFPRPGSAQRAADRLASSVWRVIVTNTVDRAAYRRRARPRLAATRAVADSGQARLH